MASPSVLVVDPAEETQEVLRAALESRGMRILQARVARQAVDLAQAHRPSVIVLDLDADDHQNGASLRQAMRDGSIDENTPVILLGTILRDTRPSEECLPRPFHYAPLIRRIEALVNSRAA